MQNEIAKYLETIKEDYKNWWALRKDMTEHVLEMIEEFNEGVRIQPGKKYIKVVTGNSVHSFIVATDTDKKFRKGDILKAASWKAPARNQARGNLFEGYTIRWTGAEYLK